MDVPQHDGGLLSILGFVSSNERVHGAIAILYLVTLGAGMGSLFTLAS